VETWRPDVLIADIGMPIEDGYGLIRKVRKLPKKKGGQTPALALTAYARTEDRVRALSEGYQVHLAKPVDRFELAAVVSSLGHR
jgi:CheY-like chemotaxis protein